MSTPEKTQEGQKTRQDPKPKDPKFDENTLYSPWIAAGRKSLSNADSVTGSAITTLSDVNPGEQKNRRPTNKPHR
jgi:hypothetical protein